MLENALNSKKENKIQALFKELYDKNIKTISSKELAKLIIIYFGSNKITLKNYVDVFERLDFIQCFKNPKAKLYYSYKIDYNTIEEYLQRVAKLEWKGIL